MKYIFLVLIFFTSLFGKNLIEPQYTYKLSSGLATDVLYVKKILYVATDDGKVEIFDTKSKKETKKINLKKIKDFMGDDVNSKIFSLDMIDKTLLILSQDSGGYSRIHLYKDNKLELVVSKDDMLNIIKAKFIDSENILMALISNDIISYNIKSKKKNWVTQASMSKFSSFALNNDRSMVVIADESGDVHVLSTKDGKNTKTLSGQNVDNIFSIDFKGDMILTGGQDRRAGIYNVKTGSGYYKASKFFVYGVGLSPSGLIGAYSSDMNNNVTLFQTSTREPIGKFASDKMIVNGIYFINEKEFFINSSSNSVRYFKIK
ncbi:MULTISPECIES: WD40 repeat domain-containing protein [Sulfurimonas]|uniref:WD40 repeat domain-containing protein n=1 Tax=Sulfurimonas TaxID=202746 RepID=UPI00126578E6|nr:WD40 repeat domain-containing protein [Sulfurimonas indica]